MRLVVEDREAGFLERLQIAAHGARRDAGEVRELVDGQPEPARAFELAEHRPLTDDLGVAGHGGILAIAELQDCRIAGRKGVRASRKIEKIPSRLHFLPSCNSAILQLLPTPGTAGAAD